MFIKYNYVPTTKNWNNTSLTELKKNAKKRIKIFIEINKDIRIFNQKLQKIKTHPSLDTIDFSQVCKNISYFLNLLRNNSNSIKTIEMIINTPDPEYWILHKPITKYIDKRILDNEKIERGELKKKIIINIEKLFENFYSAIENIKTSIKNLNLQCNFCNKRNYVYFHSIYHTNNNINTLRFFVCDKDKCKELCNYQLHYKFQWKTLSLINKKLYGFMSSIIKIYFYKESGIEQQGMKSLVLDSNAKLNEQQGMKSLVVDSNAKLNEQLTKSEFLNSRESRIEQQQQTCVLLNSSSTTQVNLPNKEKKFICDIKKEEKIKSDNKIGEEILFQFILDIAIHNCILNDNRQSINITNLNTQSKINNIDDWFKLRNR
jgi:hypothetical protein